MEERGIVVKKNISLFLFLFINLVFSIKYMDRYIAYSIPVSIVLFLFYLLMVWKKKLFFRIRFDYGVVLLLMFVAFSVYLFSRIDIHTLHVDRWSVISSFWDTCSKGSYAYMAKSFDGNYPGPMPFYFMLAYPFYLLGEPGYFSLSGLLLFFVICLCFRVERKYMNMGLFLLVSSLFYVWEVACRSNLFTNSVCILFSMLYILNTDFSKAGTIVFNGILIGLLLSTRNLFVLAYILLFMYLLIRKEATFKQLVWTGMIALLVFCLTFIPFVWGHWDAFMQMNPFIIQGSYLMPFHFTLLCIVLSFVLSFVCQSKNDILFYSGISLFLTALFYVGYHVAIDGFTAAYYGSTADISYFICCTPFFLYYALAAQENDRRRIRRYMGE